MSAGKRGLGSRNSTHSKAVHGAKHPAARSAASSKRHSGKRGFELSIGFIVMLIITVVIFAGSLTFIGKLFSSTEEIKSALDTETQGEIERLVTAGQTVAVVPSVVETRTGVNNPIGVGWINILPQASDFGIVIGFSNAFDNDDQVIVEADPDTMERWLLYSFGPYHLERSERETALVNIKPGFQIAEGVRTKSGKYVFNVCIFMPTMGKTGKATSALGDEETLTQACRQIGKISGSSVVRNDLYMKKAMKLQVTIE